MCLTKDGKLVVHHDASLSRLTGKSLLVEEVNYLELPVYSNKVEALGGCIVPTTNNKIPLL